MAFHDVDEVEQALREPRPPVRVLHEIWQQRLPVPQPAPHKPGQVPSGDGRQIRWIQADPALSSRFIGQALDRQEFPLVCDAAREVIRHWSQQRDATENIELLRVRMGLAAALTRLGYMQEASRELHAALNAAPGRRLKSDILRQLGEVHREEAYNAVDRATAVHAIEAALGFYRQAKELAPDSLENWVSLAAAALYAAGEHSSRRAEALGGAEQLLALAAERVDTEGARFLTLRARAEALALLGREDEAADAYGTLGGLEDASTAALAEARYRSRFIADALGKPRDFYKQAFPSLQLIVFSGHLPDLPDQPPRFPTSLNEQVSQRLQEKLAELGAHIGMASAAAGADLLFLEALRQRPDSLFHVILPWAEDEFRRTSVRPYEPAGGELFWEPLFTNTLQEAASIRQLGEFYEPGSSVGWNYMAEVAAGLALHTARVLRLDAQPLALWDGKPGRGAGGTADFVGLWRDALGKEPIILDMPGAGSGPALASGHTARHNDRSALRQEVKSMLFADIVGYSKLTEKVIQEFINKFLTRVSQLIAATDHRPASINTWGDAIYAVFDTPQDAGSFALELLALIHNNEQDWLQAGLYWEEPASGGKPAQKHPLNIRIGLHTGPVFHYFDPVLRHSGFTGSHVNRAARIEPVTAPGDVYVSEEFAALIELNTAIWRNTGERQLTSFVCGYGGGMALAKGYPGLYRIYRLLPARGLDTEELAGTIHKLYCEEASKRGETPEKNSMLLPWDELSENMREANREQAADIPNKLRMLGYELAYRGGLKPTELELPEAMIEEIAKYEHMRWMTERQRQGWTYAPVRDNARKLHNLLVDWEHLSETEKDKDRDTVRNLPHLLDKAGFRVRPIDTTG